MLRQKPGKLYDLLFMIVLILCFFTIYTPAFAEDPHVPDRAESPNSPMPHNGADPPVGPVPFMGPPQSGSMPWGEIQQDADKKDGVRYGNRNNLGDVTVNPSRTVNNGVILYLENGSLWRARGTSYISKLVISPDSGIEGTIEAESSEESADGTVTNIGVIVRE